MDELVKKCIAYRAVNGLSQEQMAKRCGVCREVISMFESRGRGGKLTRAKIAIVIGGGKANDRT